MDWEAALAAHLRAIQQRDLPAYAATLHDDVTLVLPNGRSIEGRAAVEQYHREFFAEPTWTQELTPLRTVAGGPVRCAVFAADYRDVLDDGQPYRRRFVLGLVFARVEDRWLLVHDQCTPLPDPE